MKPKSSSAAFSWSTGVAWLESWRSCQFALVCNATSLPATLKDLIVQRQVCSIPVLRQCPIVLGHNLGICMAIQGMHCSTKEPHVSAMLRIVLMGV